jgi:hypothetical protein
MDNALRLLAKIIADELWREIVQERPTHEDDSRVDHGCGDDAQANFETRLCRAFQETQANG